jgi:transketolase
MRGEGGAKLIPANLALKLKPVEPKRPEQQLLSHYAREIRRLTVAAIYRAGSGHPGGSLSCADLLAALYGADLYIPRDRPDTEDRDRFILSKGHAAPALYSAWCAAGLMPRAQALSLRKLGSRAQGHPHVLDAHLAETSTGSLAQGFSAGIGMALAFRHLRKPVRVTVMLGDGEMQEGQAWEAAMSGAHFGLGNLLAIVDYNKLQSDDRNAAIMGLEPLAQKWHAFGWNVLEIDGHDLGAILDALSAARRERDRPTCIVAHTIKGKGVPYMEDQPTWHGSVKLTREQAFDALSALDTTPTLIADLLDGKNT